MPGVAGEVEHPQQIGRTPVGGQIPSERKHPVGMGDAGQAVVRGSRHRRPVGVDLTPRGGLRGRVRQPFPTQRLEVKRIDFIPGVVHVATAPDQQAIPPGVQDAAAPTKNMRTIQQTVGGNTVQSEVVILATGAPNGGDTYDARQIRTLTSADIVKAILSDGTNSVLVTNTGSLQVTQPFAQITKATWGPGWGNFTGW